MNCSINQSVKYIMQDGIRSKASKIIIPKGVTELEHRAIVECERLKRVDIYGKVDSIGGKCFSYCTNLKEVHLHENVTTITRMTELGNNFNIILQ